MRRSKMIKKGTLQHEYFLLVYPLFRIVDIFLPGIFGVIIFLFGAALCGVPLRSFLAEAEDRGLELHSDGE